MAAPARMVGCKCLIIQELTPLTSKAGPARGAAAAHGSPRGTAQAADRRHDPLGGEPRARGHDHRDRCARGGPEPGDHQSSFQDQGTAADRNPAVPGRRVPQCLSRGSRPHGGFARGGLDGDGRARLPARDLRAEQARRVVCILGRAEVPPDLPPHLRRAGPVLRRHGARTVRAALRARRVPGGRPGPRRRRSFGPDRWSVARPAGASGIHDPGPGAADQP